MNTDITSFGVTVGQLRCARRMTRQQLAKRLGWPAENTVAHLERNQWGNPPGKPEDFVSAGFLARIADALALTTEERIRLVEAAGFPIRVDRTGQPIEETSRAMGHRISARIDQQVGLAAEGRAGMSADISLLEQDLAAARDALDAWEIGNAALRGRCERAEASRERLLGIVVALDSDDVMVLGRGSRAVFDAIDRCAEAGDLEPPETADAPSR